MATAKRSYLSSETYTYTDEGRYSDQKYQEILKNLGNEEQARAAAIKYEQFITNTQKAQNRIRANNQIAEEKRKQKELLKLTKGNNEKLEKQYRQLEEDLLKIQKNNEKDLDKLRKSNLSEYRKLRQEMLREELAEMGDLTKRDLRKTSQYKELVRSELADNLGKALNNTITSAMRNLRSGIDEVIGFSAQYQAKVDARLQGSQRTWASMSGITSKNLATSPYATQRSVLENINAAVNMGIARDIEQRAFLESIKDDIAGTFDAFDSNLSRIIRIQQADTTAARLGMEASLTQFLNRNFQDTAYLSDVFDPVSSALLEASATMGFRQSTEFEYEVQKWLGSLYSMGVSSTAISSIAQAIGYLGSGNVQALSGSSGATLLAMSAARSGGKTYDQLLADGLDKSSVNTLMQGMVSYLHEIATSVQGNVVASAYGNVLGLNISDIAAIRNIDQTAFENIYKSSLDYSQMGTELTRQFGLLSTRLSTQTMINNVLENLKFNIGQGIAESPLLTALYSGTSAIEDFTGGIPIPSILAAGFGALLEGVTVEQLIKDGLVGIGALTQFTNVLSSIGSAGGIDLGMWNADVLSRGGLGNLFTQNGTGSGVSASMLISSGSASDITSSALAGIDLSASEQISSSVGSSTHTADDIYNKLFPDSGEPAVINVKLQSVDGVAMEELQRSNPFSDDKLVDVISKILDIINDSGVGVNVRNTVSVTQSLY